ncbi:MAG: hypothetical protein J6Y62_04975, partial [Clostridia bacterium]|nr:hypothetical protein [Clostridia bacterium]
VVEAQVARAVKRQRKRREQADFTELSRGLDSRDASGRRVSQKVLRAEETILASLLRNPDYFEKLSGTLEASDFSTDFGQKAYAVLSERLGEGKGAESYLLSQYFDPEEMGKLSRIQNAGMPLSGTLSEVKDCVRVLKQAKDAALRQDGGEISDEELRKLFSKE